MADITYIPIRQLHPHPDNPRKELGDLSELAASIKENGVYQNLTVIPGHYLNSREYIRKCVDEGGDAAAAAAAWTPKVMWVGDDYTIIIGHRRAAAAQQAGLYELPCAIVEMDEREQMQTMMVENMQRSDLTVYEQAQGFQMMMDFGQTVEQISDKSGFSQSTVRRRIKLLELNHDSFKKAEKRGATLSDFAQLDKIEDLDARNKVLETIGTQNFAQSIKIHAVLFSNAGGIAYNVRQVVPALFGCKLGHKLFAQIEHQFREISEIVCPHPIFLADCIPLRICGILRFYITNLV